MEAAVAISRKRALVTGGGSGIGLAIATALKGAGHEVTIVGRDERKLKASDFHFFAADVTDEVAIAACISAVGPVDIFVNNAGFAKTSPSLKTTRADWDAMLALNLTAAFTCAQAVVPAMIARGWGRFIAVASTASHKAYAYTGAYAAAKHGVLGWIRTLALEHAKSGVTFNAVCPGFTDTPLIEGALDRLARKSGGGIEAAKSTLAAVNPMGRLVTTEEVAAAVTFLASEGAAAVNGQSIIVDGGEMIA
jgi:NAD(P)-dependent dehydrogenase (short-subunit alcohol dehydrogenase family)